MADAKRQRRPTSSKLLQVAGWIATAGAVLSFSAGCSGSPVTPSFDTKETEPTSAGLQRLHDGAFKLAWARPGTSFADYDALWLVYSGIKYRQDPAEVEAGRANYPMPEELMASLMESLEQIFGEAVADNENWKLTSEPAPGVLLVRVSLVDLQLTSSLRHLGGESRVWANSLGAFTVAIDVFDSESKVLLAGAAERRTLKTTGGHPIQAVPSAVTYESGRIFRHWARQLISLLTGLKAADL